MLKKWTKSCKKLIWVNLTDCYFFIYFQIIIIFKNMFCFLLEIFFKICFTLT